MKRYFKKIIPFLTVFILLCSLLLVTVGASSSVTSANDFTLEFTEMNKVVKYSNSVPNGMNLYSQPIPFASVNSWKGTNYSDFNELCDSNYFYFRMFPTTNDLKITVPAGGTYEAGLSFFMYALTGDPSTGKPPTSFSGSIPVSPDYSRAGIAFARARLVNESGSVEYFVDYDCVTNPNSASITWSDTSWKNISGEDLYVDYFEFGCSPGYESPIFYYFGQCLECVYRVYSPSETATGEIANSIKTSAEKTQKIVKESIEQATEQLTRGWTPKPQKPSGSEKLEQLDWLEQDVDLMTQYGVGQGESILNGFSNNLSQFRTAFVFVVGMFNLMLNIGWIPTLLQVALALGFVAFILNLVPAIGRAIERHKNKKE